MTLTGLKREHGPGQPRKLTSDCAGKFIHHFNAFELENAFNTHKVLKDRPQDRIVVLDFAVAVELTKGPLPQGMKVELRGTKRLNFLFILAVGLAAGTISA